MLSSLNSTRHIAEPLTRTQPTIVTGFHTARHEFHTSLHGAICTLFNSICIDASLVSQIPNHQNRRWVLIISNCSQLRALIDAIDINPTHCIIILTTDGLHEQVAVRLAAIRHLQRVAVIVSSARPNRVARIFATLMKTPEDAAKLYAEPAVLPGEDVIIPPGWDTEPKLRAAVEAVGLDWDQVVMESSWERPQKLQQQLQMIEQNEKMERLWMYEEWMKKLERVVEGHVQRMEKLPTVQVAEVNEATQIEPQTDFFQRLLARKG